jgi:phosphoribosyl 1,2-cyclic phosphate phosphodiesterase
MKLTALGTGTSHGIPVAGCGCAVCKSGDPRDKRRRTSLLIEGRGGERVVIDTGPEFRLQCLDAGLERLDAVFYTHSHADHLHGLDDLRPFCAQVPLPVYGSPPTIRDIQHRFSYIFHKTQAGGGKPKLTLHAVASPVRVGALMLTPVPVAHGSLSIYGWKIEEASERADERAAATQAVTAGTAQAAAWITDVSEIPRTSFAMLAGVKALFLGALREQRHPTHFSFAQAFDAACTLAANTHFIHICHEHSHTQIQDICNGLAAARNITAWTVEPAWDGFVLEL